MARYTENRYSSLLHVLANLVIQLLPVVADHVLYFVYLTPHLLVADYCWGSYPYSSALPKPFLPYSFCRFCWIDALLNYPILTLRCP